MANQAHLERLNGSTVAGWNQWRDDNSTIRIDLSGAKLRTANLRGANLIRASLGGADLRDANLSRANLSRANLGGADLRDADISSANLSGANLSRAWLSDADLSGADLSRTDLNWTNLIWADLNGTDLSDALIFRTVFLDTNLTDAKNLETCKHLGPSTVDLGTIERSGTLPTVFLRGCGMPEKLIDYYPSLLNQAINYYSCFISYSHADKSFARRLHDQLQGKGIRCWLDDHQIKAGDDIYAEVEKGLKLWDKVLLCASKNSLHSGWVEREIDRAYKREMDLTKKRGQPVLSIIPLDLDSHLFDWDHPHASALQKRLAPDFVGWETDNEKFEASFQKVVAALKADDTARDTPPTSKL